MNFEALEQMRFENTKKVMESLTEIVTDEKVDIELRIKAARTVDAMSDSIIKAWMSSETNGTVEKATSNMNRQIKKLTEE